jgi:hypothetical protein
MPDDMQFQSVQDAENEQPEDIIRQDYGVRVSGGQTYVMANAFRGVELPLARTLIPDFTKAVDMAVGVRVVLGLGCAMI